MTLRIQCIALLGFAAMLLLSACAYKGTVDESGFTPSAVVGGNNGPLGKSSIAFIDSAKLEDFTIGNTTGPYPFQMKIGPALKDSIIQDLRGMFATVDTTSRMDNGDLHDFYAVIETAGWRGWPGNNAAIETYGLGLHLVIVARAQKAIIGDYRPAVLVTLKHSGGETVASALSLMSMGVLAPVTEPIKNDAWGQEVQTKLKTAVDNLANQLNYALQHDQRLQTFVALGPIDLGSGSVPVRDTNGSPYGKYFDSVVIVRRETSIGSGFFVSADGLIVTCRHVVGTSQKVSVQRRDGSSLDADVIATDPERDLALIKIPGSGYPALPLLQREPVIGDEVIAIGTPEGVPWSVSKGIVSGLRSARTARLVQTDAAISPGSSGGPLIETHSGRVAGINFMIMGGAQAEKMNFAISSAEVTSAFPAQLPPP